MLHKLNLKLLAVFALLLLLTYFPLFINLNTLPIELWDESRLAISAIEMYNNGNYLVPTYMGQPDLWNTKPPLMIWCQVFFMNFIDSKELAIRLPSALAALSTIILVFYFSYRYLKDYVFSFIVAIVLVSAEGFVTMHTSRTGDYDSLLVLFETLYCFSFFTYLQTKKNLFLYLFFITITLAVLTKSVAGLFMLPGCFLFLIINKAVIPILKNRNTYLGLLFTLTSIIGYFLLREVYSPGYWEAVQANDLGGRFNENIGTGDSTFWYYWLYMIHDRFRSFYLLIPCGILLGLFSRQTRIKKLTVFSICLSIPFFLVISISKTRFFWYDAALYPFLAIIVSIFINAVYQIITSLTKERKFYKKNVIGFIFLFLVLIHPYTKAVSSSYKPLRRQDVQAKYNEYYRVGVFLRDAYEGAMNLDGYKLVHEGYNPHHEFYLIALKNKGQNIEEIEPQTIEAGNKIILDQMKVDSILKTNYQLDTLYKEHNLKVYNILGKK